MQQGQDGIHKLPLMMWSPLFWFGGQWGAADKDQSAPASTKSAPILAPLAGAADIGNGVMKASTQATSELVGLMTRRSQAVMAFAAEAAKCRAPQDLMGLQMKFWQTAMEQHTDAARKFAAAWSIALPKMPGGAIGSAVSPVRDRITLSEPDNTGAANSVSSQPNRGQGDRRSAA